MRKRRLRKSCRILKSRRGATLVELIVTFVLIALFAVGTFQIVATSLNTYYRIRDVEQSQQVADLILDKITGLVVSAQGDVEREPQTQDNEDFQNPNRLPMVVQDNTIYLTDRTGSSIAIYQKDGLLDVHYNAVGVVDSVDWKFDQAAYMDATIQSLQFSNPNKGLDTPEYPENVVRVDLTLENRGNTYHHTRYLSCYDIKKIAFQTT